ncbi:MAG: alkaline phosphatase family protein [Chromatiaceae bacterium]|nr:alkaline phosphatase family protein [Gammaproteobacteria bacterium]MCP5318423.1 alkaline phosphatase family protein [Chromatiaceae bacterium]
MPAPVIALGLDSMNADVLDAWIDAGHLPNLERLRGRGTYARQVNGALYRTENSWLTFLHGCPPEVSGEWGFQDYDPVHHRIVERSSYAFRNYAPFHALAAGKRVIAFDFHYGDVVDNVKGLQVFGWGPEGNVATCRSEPPGLLAELVDRHGYHPLFPDRDCDGSKVLQSYRVPSLYDADAMTSLRDCLVEGTKRRTAIILDLMQRGPFDLALCALNECHIAGHVFWHLSQQHPLGGLIQGEVAADYLRDVLAAIDHGIGEIVDAAPAGSTVVVFSPHGMQANTLDMNSMLFLPELLQRWNSGRAALAEGDPSGPVPPPRMDYRRHWREELWDLATPYGRTVLESPLVQAGRGDPLDWLPGHWYRPLWPAMRAFALPGYSDGLIRINVAGRDGESGVPVSAYSALCDELAELVGEVTDSRTGKPLVARVLRTRGHPEESGSALPPADLIVCWRDDVVTDVVEHPRLGRVGPAPYFRSGGHTSEGFCLLVGEGFTPGARIGVGQTPDLTATLLAMMGVAEQAHVSGYPIARAIDAECA